MPFVLRPYRRFPVQCTVTYNAGAFQGQGTVWNLSLSGWKLSGDLPLQEGLKQKGLCTKQDRYDIISEFRRKNPREDPLDVDDRTVG